MPAKLYRVNLTQDEGEHWWGVTRRGKSSGRKVKRALILCKADAGLTDQQVAEALMVGPSTVGPSTVGPSTVGPSTVGPSTVGRVRQRFVAGGFVAGGLERALNDLPRPGQRRKLDGKGVNLMESRKPTWWPWPAARPRKGTLAGRCDCLPTQW